MYGLQIFAAGLVLFFSGAGGSDAGRAQIIAGGRIAQRSCGACHAVGSGASPLAHAPPFADLYRRYPPGGLPQILEEGMIAPISPPEEGPVLLHPSMPMAVLDENEIAELKAYLSSLEPQSRRMEPERK